MTDEMLELARRNAAEAGATNVEFLKGHIEAIPLPAASVDVIISNCVINLAADKDAVFAEAIRVLRPGGRLAVADIVLTKPLPPAVGQIMALWAGCAAGALTNAEYAAKLTAAGFTDVDLQVTQTFDRDTVAAVTADTNITLPDGVDTDEIFDLLADTVTSTFVRARKPS
jgi:predicted O-methyltransferase YrrM